MTWNPDCTEDPCTCPGESVGTEYLPDLVVTIELIVPELDRG